MPHLLNSCRNIKPTNDNLRAYIRDNTGSHEVSRLEARLGDLPVVSVIGGEDGRRCLSLAQLQIATKSRRTVKDGGGWEKLFFDIYTVMLSTPAENSRRQ